MAVKTLYGGQFINQSDLTTYENQDIVISGTNVIIDGEHSFKSLTLDPGASITTSDFNRYGLMNESDTSRTASSLFHYENIEYVFVFRGYINTGANHDLTYSVSSGISTDSTYTQPRDFRVDDVMSIEFYNPVGIGSTYDTNNWIASKKLADHSYNWQDDSSPDMFTDTVSSNTNPLIPFEARFGQIGSAQHFGISYCGTASCSSVGNHFFLKNIPQATSFKSDSVTPELKTYAAWQGRADEYGAGGSHGFSEHVLTSVRDNYNDWTSYVTDKVNCTGYGSSEYGVYCINWKTDKYDIATDRKVSIMNEKTMLETPRFEEIVNQRENGISPMSTIIRPYSFFYPKGTEISPLASRLFEAEESVFNSGFPTISNSLATYYPRKLKTVLHVANTITVKEGAKINVNGKGFAKSPLTSTMRGSGPGGSSGSIEDDQLPGASHAGSGGDGTGRFFVGPVYDAEQDVEPLLPGSAPYVREDSFEGNGYVSYGGGYIKLIAKKIDLRAGSIVTANGVGGNGGYNAAASGGSVVLIDDDSNSNYGGLISAVGGNCRRNSGSGHSHGDCTYGGGGGGHIYISTATDISELKARKIADSTYEDRSKYPEYTNYGGDDIDNFFEGPAIKYWTLAKWDGGFLPNAITAAGGRTEGPVSRWGKPGIVSILGKTSDRASVKKTVVPYNVNPGDTVTILLEIAKNGVASYDIEDEILNDGIGKYFTVVGTLPQGCTSDSKLIKCSGMSSNTITYQLKSPIN